VAKLLWAEEPTKADLLMIWQKDKWILPILQVFIEISRETLTPA
jgi:hypothetical protein